MAKGSGYVLSIDCGSTNLKVAVFDSVLNCLGKGSVPVPYLVYDTEHVEFDVEEIWHAIVTLIRQTCINAGIIPTEIAKLVLTSQAQTFTVLDPSGKPLMPFFSWLDRRAIKESSILVKRFGADFHYHCGSPRPIPQLQLAKVLWLQQHHPEWLSSGCTIVSLPGFLTLRFGGFNAIDRNLAAMSGLYSLQAGDWWSEVIDFCGLRKEQLPLLVDTGEALVTLKICTEIAFSPKIEIVLAGNDQTSGAVGNACTSERMVANLGTALVIYRQRGARPGPFTANGCWGPFPGGGYYELATNNTGCVALNWACSQLLPKSDVSTFMAIAESAKSASHDLLFYPEHMGTEEAWRGAGDTISRARAVLEGISFSLRRLLVEGLNCDIPLPSICITGGGSKSRFWLQMLADVLNSRVSQGKGDALLGAAMIAMPGVVPPVQTNSEFVTPSATQVMLYEDLYQRWIEKNEMLRCVLYSFNSKRRLVI